MIWPEFENENGEIITETHEMVRETGTAGMWIVMDHMRTFHRDKIKIGTKGFMMEACKRMDECEVIELNGLLTQKGIKELLKADFGQLGQER